MTLNEQLLNAFQPVVEKELAKAFPAKDYARLVNQGLAFAITEIENCNLAHIFTLDITIPRKLDSIDLKKIVERLDPFCVCEEHGRKIEGVEWVIGDGDDSGAVEFFDNAFHIWVRSFG